MQFEEKLKQVEERLRLWEADELAMYFETIRHRIIARWKAQHALSRSAEQARISPADDLLVDDPIIVEPTV